jgi:hypothetical protein
MAFSQTGLIEIILPASIEVLGEKCFSECRSLSSITFESGSRLSRIGKMAFLKTGLVEMIHPASIEVLGANCFSECSSLISVTFESGSRFLGNQREVLSQAGWIVRDVHPQVEEELKNVSD